MIWLKLHNNPKAFEGLESRVSIIKVHVTTKPEDKELLSKLRKLISTNEKIKKAEAEFRLSCKEELAVLEEQNASSRQKLEEIAALDGRSPEGARRYLGASAFGRRGSKP